MSTEIERSAEGLDVITRREAVSRVLSMLGGAVSAPTIVALLAACNGRDTKGDGATSARSGAAMSGDQKEMIATIAEHIIPQTDTPGARGVGVHDFIAQLLDKYYPPQDREAFVAGLANVDERARTANNKRFLDCTPEQQVALLTALDRETMEQGPPSTAPTPKEVRERVEPGTGGTPLPPGVVRDTTPRDTAGWRAAPLDTTRWQLETPPPRRLEDRHAQVPFWRTMKELTLVGYYTSEPGATKELRYEAIPARYDACVPLAQIGRAWSV